jgi:hypothetical protein
MFEEYNDEATRTAAFRDVFEEYGLKLESNKVKILAFTTNGAASAKGHLYLLSEWNNVSADPELQAFMYYLESLKSGDYGGLRTRLPCLIVYYAGERIHANLIRTPWLTV